MRVAKRLAGLFIDENLKDREQTAQVSSRFLESELEDAHRRLMEQEKKLENYRRANAGQLPSQVQSNLAGINTAQLQVQRLQDTVARDRDQLQLIERQIADANALDAVAEPALDPNGAVSGGSTAQQLEAAKTALRNMELRLKPEHPDIGRMRRLIARLEEKAQKESLEAPLSAEGPSAAPRSKAEVTRANRLRDLELSADRIRKAIAANEAEQNRVRGLIAGYQQRLEAAPTRETELIELTRDYDGLQKLYNGLLSKSEDSKLTVNLEARQGGQQFRILDQARVPARPFSPKRERINAVGAFGGMALGVLTVFLIVYLDSSLKTDEDVTGALALPVLALVPLMQTVADRRRMRRRQLILAGVSTVVLFGLVGGVAWWVVTRT